MKKNYPVLVSGIVLCCLFGAKAYTTTPGTPLPVLFSINHASEVVLQMNNDKAFEDTEKHIVTYKSPFHYNFNKDTRWEIIHMETGLPYKNGIGTITNMIFDTPGNYVIHVFDAMTHHDDSCEHTHFPEKILLEVSPYQMLFDFSTIKLSKNIVGNRQLGGTTLTVDVLFTSYDNTTATFTQNFTTAGVRSSLTGKLKNGGVILQQGINTLEYQLEGQVASGTYISIDFMDMNGQIQSYSFINKIK